MGINVEPSFEVLFMDWKTLKYMWCFHLLFGWCFQKGRIISGVLDDIINNIGFYEFCCQKNEVLREYGLCSEIRNIYLKKKVRYTKIKKTLTDTIDAWHKRSTRVLGSEKQRRARNINCELKRELQILKWDENFRGVIKI